MEAALFHRIYIELQWNFVDEPIIASLYAFGSFLKFKKNFIGNIIEAFTVNEFNKTFNRLTAAPNG
jgi:hypothetical protein